MKPSKISSSKHPDYRMIYDPDLQAYIEQFMTEDRKILLRNTIENRTRHIVLVAENLYDEHNIHAMIRSSECFGIQDFHNISKENAILKKNKVTRGAFQWTHVHNYDEVENPTRTCIQNLRSLGYRIYCTSSHIDTEWTPFNIPIDLPTAIVLGNEHEGVSQHAMDLSDGMIRIPMYGFTESYNVSVAASLILQPLIERLRTSDLIWGLSDEEKRDLYYRWIWFSIKYPDVLYREWLVNKNAYPSF